MSWSLASCLNIKEISHMYWFKVVLSFFFIIIYLKYIWWYLLNEIGLKFSTNDITNTENVIKENVITKCYKRKVSHFYSCILVYLSVNPLRSNVLTFTIRISDVNFDRRWKIRVSQICCDQISMGKNSSHYISFLFVFYIAFYQYHILSCLEKFISNIKKYFIWCWRETVQQTVKYLFYFDNQASLEEITNIIPKKCQ